MAAATPAGDHSAPSARTLVIIPTYNERENIRLIVGRLHAALPDVHVLIADDGSPDGTGAVADELAAASEGRIHVLHRTEKNGLGAAYIAGFRWGLERDYTVLVEMDADGSHAPEQLHLLLEKVDAGADLVLGSRYVPGGTVGAGRERCQVMLARRLPGPVETAVQRRMNGVEHLAQQARRRDRRRGRLGQRRPQRTGQAAHLGDVVQAGETPAEVVDLGPPGRGVPVCLGHQ